jgi:hypothetical protein
MRLRKIALLALVALSLSACFEGRAHVAQARAAYDMSCAQENIHAFRVVGGTFVAEGCGMRTEYACIGNAYDITCVRISPVTPARE